MFVDSTSIIVDFQKLRMKWTLIKYIFCFKFGGTLTDNMIMPTTSTTHTNHNKI